MKKFATLFLSLFLLISAVAPSHAFAETGNTTGWVVEGEKKYYYDKPGVKHTGLLRSEDDTYLFDKSGNLTVGWNTVDGKDYYFDRTTGAALKGWFPQATHWYFANDESVIQKGDVTYMDKNFQFDRTGKVPLQSFLN